MHQTEQLFEVTAKIVSNGKKLICATFRSTENYDNCHYKIEQWINKNTKPGDSIVTHILNTAYFQVPLNY